MAYNVFLDGVLLPITPAKLEIKVTNQNKTINLINGEEINFLKSPGLSEVQFDAVIPQVSYPFTNGGGRGADYYLSKFERLKTGKTPFQYIVSRVTPSGKALFDTNLKVGLEDYKIVDNAKDGLDITVTIKLKQWKPFGTKTVVIEAPSKPTQTPKATVEKRRDASTAPQKKTYTVKSGDTLWNIAKQYLGDGSRYKDIYNLNKDKITGPNNITVGQILTLP